MGLEAAVAGGRAGATVASAAVCSRSSHIAWVVLLLSGCAGPRLQVATLQPGEVLVQGLEVAFNEPGNGELKLELVLEGVGEPVQAQAVDWELWLDNRYFAAGVEQVAVEVAPRGETALPLKLPLHFPKLPQAGEAQRLKVSARGGVVLRGGAREERHPFQASVHRSVERAPVLAAPPTTE